MAALSPDHVGRRSTWAGSVAGAAMAWLGYRMSGSPTLGEVSGSGGLFLNRGDNLAELTERSHGADSVLQQLLAGHLKQSPMSSSMVDVITIIARRSGATSLKPC
jgi:hypothetical protein